MKYAVAINVCMAVALLVLHKVDPRPEDWMAMAVIAFSGILSALFYIGEQLEKR